MIIVGQKSDVAVSFDKVQYFDIDENSLYLFANYDDNSSILLGNYLSVKEAQNALDIILKAYENNKKVVRL